MKGLVRQDMLVLFSRNIFYTISVLGLLLVIFALCGMGVFAITLPIVVVTKFGVSAFHYESRSRWNKFACTLPISRSRIVLARYATALILTGAGVVLSVLYAVLMHVFRAVPLEACVVAVGCAIALAWLLISTSFPMLYRFGAERASNYITLLDIIVYAVLGVAFSIFSITDLKWIFLCVGVLSFVSLVLSYSVSVGIYRARDIG